MEDNYTVRRVVTGHNAEGISVVASDEVIDTIKAGGGSYAFVWGRDKPGEFPDDGSEPPMGPAVFPPVGGCRLAYNRLLPGQIEEYDRFVSEAIPGDSVPGMHRSKTMDFDIVLEGQLSLELEDGTKVTLNPGDSVIQNGTRHHWRNESDLPVVFVAVTIGAHNSRVPN